MEAMLAVVLIITTITFVMCVVLLWALVSKFEQKPQLVVEDKYERPVEVKAEDPIYDSDGEYKDEVFRTWKDMENIVAEYNALMSEDSDG